MAKKHIAKKQIACVSCGGAVKERDAIGANKKLLGENVDRYFCLDCLADYLGCEKQDLLDKIEGFKEEGCKLFS